MHLKKLDNHINQVRMVSHHLFINRRFQTWNNWSLY